jgi:outer membrane protein assembly factor BamB
VLGLAAACGGTQRHAAPPPATTHAAAPPAVRRPRAVHHRALLVVTVIDGDRWRRLPGAVVRLWGRSARTDPHGVAEIRVPWRRPLHVNVNVRGYGGRTVYEDFAAHRKLTVRVYRPDLQWPLYGAVDTRTQSQVHIRLRPPFHTVWAVPMGGLIEFPAVVSDGVAYIGNATATVHAISMVKGTVIWSHATPHGKMASSPAVVGRQLVYHGMDGNVWVLDRATGRLLWHFHVGSPVESSPIVENGIDYFGAWNGRMYALDLRTHRLRWSRSLGAKITSSAAIAGSMLYIGDYAGRLWALAPRTGATRWTARVNGRIYGTPAVAGGRVFAPSSNGGSLTAFTTGGRMLWRFSPGAYVYSSPAVWGGRVFVGSYNGVFYALSAASGRVQWEVGTGGAISGAAVVVDGVAYAGSFADRIVGVDARTGHVVMRFKHGQYVPVSGNGMQLLFHGYSTLYAVQPTERQIASHRR